MANILKWARATTGGNRPSDDIKKEGTPYINFADMQIGVLDSTGVPQDLLAIRKHSSLASYVKSDFVLHADSIYIATKNIVPGVFTAIDWVKFPGSTGDFVKLTGDTMTGDLITTNAILSGINTVIPASTVAVVIYTTKNDDDDGTAASTAGLSSQYVLIAEATQIVIYDVYSGGFPLVKTISGLTNVTSLGVVNGQIMVGTLTGLHLYDMFNAYLEGSPPAIINSVVNDLQGFSDGSMGITWAIASKGGLSLIQPDNSVIEQLTGTEQTAVYVDLKLKSASINGTINIWNTPPTTSSVTPDSTKQALPSVSKIVDNHVGSATGLTVFEGDALQYIGGNYNSGVLYPGNKIALLANSYTKDRGLSPLDLVKVGTVRRGSVVTGSALVGYSGWSTSAYLKQSHNTALEFGLNDCYLMGWMKVNNTTSKYGIIERGLFNSRNTSRIALYIDAPSGNIAFVQGDSTHSATESHSTFTVSSGVWAFVACIRRRDGKLDFYLDAAKETIAAVTKNINGPYSYVGIGITFNRTTITNGTLALCRMGSGFLSESQVNYIYQQELPFFQGATNKTLGGSSDDIVTIAKDSTKNIQVATTTDLSIFNGSNRINTTNEVVTGMAFEGSLAVKGN